jgi:cytochrome P450 family 28
MVNEGTARKITLIFNFLILTETLRLHSPGIYLSRYCNESVEVEMPKDKNLFCEKGLILLIPIVSIHMDPEYFPNPKQFDPDRFSPENGGIKTYIDRGEYLPFGNGPR